MRTSMIVAITCFTVACSKTPPPSEPAPSTEPAATTTPPATEQSAADTATTPEVAPAEPAPEEPGAAAAQCARILEKAWKVMQPALAKLGLTDLAAHEDEVRVSGYDTRDFLEKCPTTPRAYRDCVEAGENPLHFARPCAERMDPQPEVPRVPGVPDKASPLLAPVPLAADAGPALIAKLVGTWEQSGPFGVETWAIDASGKVEVTRVRDGKTEAKRSTDSFTMAFEHAGTVTVDFGTNKQTRSFFLAEDGKTFYSSGNLMWSVYPLGDGKTFVAKAGFDWVLVKDGACEVVTSYGSVVPATCAFAERDGMRFFDVGYQVPGKVRWRTTELEPTAVSFPILGNDLLAPELFKQQAFSKK